MKKREIGNLFLHIGVGCALAALVLYHRWFLLLVTFIYAWLREQGQHRYKLTLSTRVGHEEARLYRVQKSTFLGWMQWDRMFEVFQWVIGAALALLGYEIIIRLS